MVKTSSRPRIKFGIQPGSGTGARHPKARDGKGCSMPILLTCRACVTHMMPRDWVQITHMNVWVTHTNATCAVAYPIPLTPLASFQAIVVGMTLKSLVVVHRKKPLFHFGGIR